MAKKIVIQPSAEMTRMAFEEHLVSQGFTHVKVTLDGPIDLSATMGSPKIIQTVIVQAGGMKPTRFRLVGANGSWSACKAGSRRWAAEHSEGFDHFSSPLRRI